MRSLSILRYVMSKTNAKIRLYVEDALGEGQCLQAADAQAHYLLNVMRRTEGHAVALFNGRDGEWEATISIPAKRRVQFAVGKRLRAQEAESDLWIAFAPVKRMDILAEKASELGVAAILPVFTQRADIRRVNVHRLQANATEAAEQCSRLSVPVVHDPQSFDRFISDWPRDRQLFFLDETGGGAPIAQAFENEPRRPSGFLTGPEGGFVQSELDALRQLPFATPVGLGPRLLRAETAAIAALACWQALVGDWAPGP